MMDKTKKKESKETPPQGTVEELDSRAKDILAKPNLRALLEDKELQRVGVNSNIPSQHL